MYPATGDFDIRRPAFDISYSLFTRRRWVQPFAT